MNYPFWQRQAQQWSQYNAYQAAHKGAPVPAPSDDVFNTVSPACTFTLSPDLVQYSTPNTGISGTYWYGDAVLFKNYAGGKPNYISWISNTNNPVNTSGGHWSKNRVTRIKFPDGSHQDHNTPYEYCSCSTVAQCQHQTIGTPAWYLQDQ